MGGNADIDPWKLHRFVRSPSASTFFPTLYDRRTASSPYLFVAKLATARYQRAERTGKSQLLGAWFLGTLHNKGTKERASKVHRMKKFPRTYICPKTGKLEVGLHDSHLTYADYSEISLHSVKIFAGDSGSALSNL
jgi:hypothetical protein